MACSYVQNPCSMFGCCSPLAGDVVTTIIGRCDGGRCDGGFVTSVVTQRFAALYVRCTKFSVQPNFVICIFVNRQAKNGESRPERKPDGLRVSEDGQRVETVDRIAQGTAGSAARYKRGSGSNPAKVVRIRLFPRAVRFRLFAESSGSGSEVHSPLSGPVALPKIKQSFNVAEQLRKLNWDQVLQRMLKMLPKLHDKDKSSHKSRKRDEVCKEQTQVWKFPDGNFTAL